MKTSLQPDKRVIADATYKDECCILPHEELQKRWSLEYVQDSKQTIGLNNLLF